MCVQFTFPQIYTRHEVFGAGCSHCHSYQELLGYTNTYAFEELAIQSWFPRAARTQGYGPVEDRDAVHFVELCAGAARLTQVHREFGFTTLPMDVTLACHMPLF